MGDFKQPINENGYMKDIYQTTRNEYMENNEPIIFNNRRSYSLKGIIQETPMSNLFFSDMNVKAIQMTIRYKIHEEKNKKIAFQSENELFVIMRSIYLQYANSVLTSDQMITNLRTLNKMVVDYASSNIGDQLDQYDGYLQKISSAPVPMEHPRAGNTDSYTYDMSNILF
tara:strand:+ start:74 stop:583 length:510 start_codon:yes stop_codon:yes gene_type:complete